MEIEEIFKNVENNREAVSMLFGYFPAWKTAELYHTHGLRPIDILPALKKVNLKIDWNGFRLEMINTGMGINSVDSMIEEAKFFERFLSNNGRDRRITK